jgi:hypothetical protein
MRCRRIGVWPRGAQVRRVGGVNEAPDSSRKQSHAPRRAAPLDPGPLLADPAGNLGVVALAGAAGGPLQAPAVAAQQPPHVPGVVADPGQPPDHLGNPRQGPQVGVEPLRHRAGQQRPLHPPPVALRQPRGAAPAARAGQPRPAALAPAGMPAAGGLPRDPKAAGDLGLRQALGEQAVGLQAALPGGRGAQGTGRGRGALGHDHRLTTREASECHPILRASVATTVLLVLTCLAFAAIQN